MKIVKANPLFGLMFRKEKSENEAYLFNLGFETRLFAAIHTFFCHYALDMVFFDKDRKIVDLRGEIKPWSIVVPMKKARYVLEFASGLPEKDVLEVIDTFQEMRE